MGSMTMTSRARLSGVPPMFAAPVEVEGDMTASALIVTGFTGKAGLAAHVEGSHAKGHQ